MSCGISEFDNFLSYPEMSISIWRYIHLILAAVSAVFLLVASVTGVILAVEPIVHQAKGFAVRDLEEVSVAQAVKALEQNFQEVFSVEVEPAGFVKASVLTPDFETRDIYFDPLSGEELGEVPTRHPLFSFSTNLHRSLFLKSTGRFLIGLVSLLLFVIAITGIILVVKRQGGIARFFSKVRKEYFAMRYHVIISRWVFLPIMILSLTGVYLSAEKFELLPATASPFKENPQKAGLATWETSSEIPFFKQTPLSEVRKIEFPFSDEPDDFFQVALKDKEIKVNRQTGAIMATANYPVVQLVSQISFTLHTGEGSVLWSLVLLLASASLLFFIYSGFVMAVKRLKKSQDTTIDKPVAIEECEYVLLVGSETGTTIDFAQRLLSALINSGQKACIAQLNEYQQYNSATHLVILTATYGDGEPPTNARFFEDLFEEVEQEGEISYAVVGFGSLEYPEYCAFAVTVEKLFQQKDNFKPALPLFKVNDASFTAFAKWVGKWGESTGLELKLKAPKEKRKKLKQWAFEVLERTDINEDDTFLLRLEPDKKLKYTSGDLLAIVPEGSKNPRQYSIAKMENEIVLSIKIHPFGKGSNFLYSLNPGDSLSATVEPNPHFHLPKKSKSAVLIANGTGIAPFLGMLRENSDMDIHLLWGTRTHASCRLYDTVLGENNCVFASAVSKGVGIYRCFSREANEKRYVQDLVREQADVVLRNFENNGTCMICGSLSMQNDVLDEIDRLLRERSKITLDILVQKGQLKMDCY